MSNEITTTQTREVVNQPKNTIQSFLAGDQFKMQVAKALPKHLTPEKFVRITQTAIQRVPKLLECDQRSFFKSVLDLSASGLVPDGRMAYLIPYENRKMGIVECQLIISYLGLFEMAMRSGEIQSIHTDKVCENDTFEYNMGQILSHKIDFRRPRGKVYAYYALVRYKAVDGFVAEKADVMTIEDIDRIRARSKAGNSGPWVTDYDEMAKKTVFRRLSKWLRLSSDYHDALEKDGDQVPMSLDEVKPVIEMQEVPRLPKFTVPTEAPAKKQTAPAPEPAPALELESEFMVDEPNSVHDKLRIGIQEHDVTETQFFQALKKYSPGIKAKQISDLSVEAASSALNELNEILAVD